MAVLVNRFGDQIDCSSVEWQYCCGAGTYRASGYDGQVGVTDRKVTVSQRTV